MNEATNAIEVKKQQELSTIMNDGWGTEESTSQDIIIPKLLLMHGQSQLVQDGKANIGDLVRSTDSKVLAKKGDKVELVIFYQAPKTWVIQDITDDAVDFVREELFQVGDKERFTDQDGNFVGEFTEQVKDRKSGKMAEHKMRRNFTHNFYGVLRSEIKPGEFPIAMKLQFARTSARVGRTISDHFAKCSAMKKPGAIISFKIGSDVVKGDKHTYQIFTVDYGTDTTPQEMMPCKEWWQIIKANKGVKDHEVQDVAEAAPAQSAPVAEEDREF